MSEVSSDVIINLYNGANKLSLRKIDSMFELPKGTARNMLASYDIPIRNRKEQCNTAGHKARQKEIAHQAGTNLAVISGRSERLKAKWQDDDWKESILKKREEAWAGPDIRQAARERLIKCWKSRKYRNHMRESLRHSWENPETHNKRAEAIRLAQQDPLVSEKKKAAMILKWQEKSYRELVKESLSLYWSKPKNRRKRGRIMKNVWQKPEYQEAVSTGLRKSWANQDRRKRRSNLSKEMWDNPQIKARIISFLRSPQNRLARSRFFIAFWAIPENKALLSEQCKENWAIQSLNILLAISDDDLKNSRGFFLLNETEKNLLALYACGRTKEIPGKSRKTLREALQKIKRLSISEKFFMF